MHKAIEPKILYFGTPVALITTLDVDGSANIGPMSSVWALGWTALLGIDATSKTAENLVNQRECVLNFPSDDLFTSVEKLAPLTGKNPVPPQKASKKFRYERDKFKAANLTPQPSVQVTPPRIKECPLQFEAIVRNIYPIAQSDEHSPSSAGAIAAEVSVVRIHAREDIVINENYINPNAWRPLIYNFRHYFGLGAELGKTFRAQV